MRKLDKETKVLIATFSVWKSKERTSLNGNVEPLLDFFVPKVQKTVLIDQPYPGSNMLIPRIEVHENNKKPKVYFSSKVFYVLYPFLKMKNYNATHIPFKIRDFFSIIDWCIRDTTRFDFFIGLEAINALAGILLKKLGKIRTVIYYVSDYSPKRYSNRWFNALYLRLDRFCAMNADYIWDVSKAMQPARVKAGLNPKKSAPVLHVPNALYPSQIVQEKPSKIIPYSLVFMGTLGPENGPDISIQAMPLVLKKYPQAILNIVGGGISDLIRLQNLTNKLKLTGKIKFHGFISDREKTSKMIRKFHIALAPYPEIAGSPRLYGDATKIRAYLGSGLPVITTYVPPLGKEAADRGAAVQVKGNPKDIAKAIIKIFSNKNFYRTLRKNTIAFAKDNTWENEFSKAFEQINKSA